jgi:purine nucleosidase
MLTSHSRYQTEKLPSYGGPLHDPGVIAYLLEPRLFSGRFVNVAIETQSDLTLGETVVDWRKVTPRPANALWINEVDPDGFYSLLTETVAQLS